jgi:glycosyltransferase involved in cell wall biosynthesis
MKSTLQTISIVIPAYNEEKYIGACLQAIAQSIEQTKNDFDIEVIVVDNASTDSTASVVSTFPTVRLIHESKKGLTCARQAGLEAASGGVVAYVDADTRMPLDWIPRVMKEFSRDPKTVCVSGPHRYYDISLFDSIIVWVFWYVFSYPLYLVIGYMVAGVGFVVRKKAMLAIGGFDTSISFYGEDTNVARRLHAVGNVQFILSLYMPTSGRRLNGEGIIGTGYRYAINFFSEAFLKRPASGAYRDIR